MNKNEDLIKKLIIESELKTRSNGQLTKEEIQKRLKAVDKKLAVEKLRSMGLGPIAEKLKNMTDDELIKMISDNPSILKKLNSFLK